MEALKVKEQLTPEQVIELKNGYIKYLEGFIEELNAQLETMRESALKVGNTALGIAKMNEELVQKGQELTQVNLKLVADLQYMNTLVDDYHGQLNEAVKELSEYRRINNSIPGMWTAKSLIWQSVHEDSRRGKNPWVLVRGEEWTAHD